jgi:hypothetical protein
MVTVSGESKMYQLLCGHSKRLKVKTAEKGKIYCWACQREVKVGEPIAA